MLHYPVDLETCARIEFARLRREFALTSAQAAYAVARTTNMPISQVLSLCMDLEMGGMHGTVAIVGVRSAIADLNNTLTDLTQRIHAI